MSDTETLGSAYRVLARKYRPTHFDDLIGQDAMVRTLTNAFETGRIAQGFMLTGVRGVGKTTTARILARGLNYELPDGSGAPSVNLDTEGVHCRAIIEGRHVDVQEMDAASHTGINDIREITDAARYKPMNARYKVFVIDEVHMLSNAAFNGLLKTLEEPPEHVKFIFATTEIRKVPVTILSRCQRFDLRRVDLGLLSSHLQKIAGLENMALDDEAAQMLARAAEGSVRDGLSLLDQAIAHQGDSGLITPNLIASMLGLGDRTRIYDVLDSLFSGDAKAALSGYDALYQAGGDPFSLLSEMLEAVHLVTKAKVAPDALQAVGLPEAERARAEQMAGHMPLRVLTRAWQLLLKGAQELQMAARPKQALDMLLVRVAHAADMPTPDDLIKTIQNGAPMTAHSARPAGTAPQRVPQPTARSHHAVQAAPIQTLAPAPMPDTPPQAQLHSFSELIALVTEKRDIALKIALERNVHLVGFQPGQIELRLTETIAPSFVGELQKKLTQWTGQRWMVVLSKEQGEPTLYEVETNKKQAMTDGIKAHPAVQAVMHHFPGAQIVDIRVKTAAPAAIAPLEAIIEDED